MWEIVEYGIHNTHMIPGVISTETDKTVRRYYGCFCLDAYVECYCYACDNTQAICKTEARFFLNRSLFYIDFLFLFILFHMDTTVECAILYDVNNTTKYLCIVVLIGDWLMKRYYQKNGCCMSA